MRLTRLQSQRWRDVLWESVLDEYAERNPEGAALARVAGAGATRSLYGESTGAAARAWSHLDFQAREDWIWVCRFVNRTWIHGMQAALGYTSNRMALP